MSNLSKDLILDGIGLTKKVEPSIGFLNLNPLMVVRSYGVKLLTLDIIEIISSMKRSVML